MPIKVYIHLSIFRCDTLHISWYECLKLKMIFAVNPSDRCNQVSSHYFNVHEIEKCKIATIEYHKSQIFLWFASFRIQVKREINLSQCMICKFLLLIYEQNEQRRERHFINKTTYIKITLFIMSIIIFYTLLISFAYLTNTMNFITNSPHNSFT